MVVLGSGLVLGPGLVGTLWLFLDSENGLTSGLDGCLGDSGFVVSSQWLDYCMKEIIGLLQLPVRESISRDEKYAIPFAFETEFSLMKSDFKNQLRQV